MNDFFLLFFEHLSHHLETKDLRQTRGKWNLAVMRIELTAHAPTIDSPWVAMVQLLCYHCIGLTVWLFTECSQISLYPGLHCFQYFITKVEAVKVWELGPANHRWSGPGTRIFLLGLEPKCSYWSWNWNSSTAWAGTKILPLELESE